MIMGNNTEILPSDLLITILCFILGSVLLGITGEAMFEMIGNLSSRSRLTSGNHDCYGRLLGRQKTFFDRGFGEGLLVGP